MIPSLADHPVFALALLLIGSVVSILGIGRLDRLATRGSALEAWVLKWAGAGQALVVALAVLAAVHLIYRGDAPTWRLLTAGVFGVAVWAGRHALSDWGSGIVLRSEGTLQSGGRIGFQGARGRIRRLGLRSAEFEAEDGRLLRLPYGSLAGVAIETSSDDVAARSHTFSVRIVGKGDPVELMLRLTREALLSPWSAAKPSPSVRLVESDAEAATFEVTVHPLDPTQASRVEQSVRLSVGA